MHQDGEAEARATGITEADVESAVERVFERHFGGFRAFVDRRLAEVSTEVAATVELLEIQDRGVRNHLSEVQKTLHRMADDSHRGHLVKSGVELAFVVDVTEQAANRIMDAAERLAAVTVSGALDPAVQEEMRDLSSILFEACSFQDLVGQRVRRVCTQLKEAERAISEALGLDADVPPPVKPPVPGSIEETGPVEMSQDDIDRLLS